MNLSGQVADFVGSEALLEPKQRLVVGVSGGADSLCLLRSLQLLGYRPVVAHYDHRLRAESAEEAKFVRGIANQYGLPFELGHALAPTISSEEQARLDRYRFLAATAKQHELKEIAVGHTLDDQVETVLMHLLRGAGPAGLRGMRATTPLTDWTGIPDSRGLHVVRPLLEVGRKQTVEFCAAEGLEPLDDPSNHQSYFFRNRIRHQLIPLLETYNPRLREVLLRTSKVMAAETELIDDLVELEWAEWMLPAGEGALAIRVDSFLDAPLALQRAAIRRGLRELIPGIRDIGLAGVDRALAAIRHKTRQTLTGGIDLVHQDGKAILLTPGSRISVADVPQLRKVQEQVLSLPFSVELAAGWKLEGSEIATRQMPAHDQNQAWFDREQLRGRLRIRTAQPGDRIKPIGMSGSMKLSDLFVNRKVPRLARRLWPVVTCGGEVAWVAGLHRSRAALLRLQTKRALRLRLAPPDLLRPNARGAERHMVN